MWVGQSPKLKTRARTYGRTPQVHVPGQARDQVNLFASARLCLCAFALVLDSNCVCTYANVGLSPTPPGTCCSNCNFKPTSILLVKQ